MKSTIFEFNGYRLFGFYTTQFPLALVKCEEVGTEEPILIIPELQRSFILHQSGRKDLYEECRKSIALQPPVTERPQ